MNPTKRKRDDELLERNEPKSQKVESSLVCTLLIHIINFCNNDYYKKDWLSVLTLQEETITSLLLNGGGIEFFNEWNSPKELQGWAIDPPLFNHKYQRGMFFYYY